MIANEKTIHQSSNKVNLQRTAFNNEKTHSVWSAIKGPDMKNFKQFN